MIEVEVLHKIKRFLKSEYDVPVGHDVDGHALVVEVGHNITKSLGLSSDRVLNRMANTGNLVSSSIPAVYKMASDEGLIESGQRIVLCGFGVGLLWGASLAIVP